MKMIEPNEVAITGQWIVSQGHSVADSNCHRISELTEAHLVQLGYDSSGWDALYRDPNDGRLWEMIYPQGHMHGGGPPQLRCILANDAKRKYGDVVTTP